MNTSSEEDQYLRKIVQLLDSTKQYETLVHSESAVGWDVQPGSSLAGDDTKTRPFHLSHLAWQALTCAIDHLHCFRSALVGEQKGGELPLTLHITGQYSLLRGAFENSARAVWLLSPTQRPTRVQRRLAYQAKDDRHGYRLAELMNNPPNWTVDQRIERLAKMVEAAGIPPGEGRKALKGAEPSVIVRAAGEHIAGMGATQAEVVWSACSALAHGDQHGLLSILDREVVQTDGITVLTRLSSNPKLLYWATNCTLLVIRAGFDLFQQRARHY